MIQAPQPKKIEHYHELHDDRRFDPYHWMRERDSAPVLEYLGQENAYFKAVLGGTQSLQDELYNEMRSRIKEEDTTAPTPHGQYEYFVRTLEGKEYPVHCRQRRGGGSEETLLDVNLLAQGLSYCDVSNLRPSPDHKLIAFALDRVGRRLFSILTKNLETGEISKVELPGSTGNFVWANDNETILATIKHPETFRAEKCVRWNTRTGELSVVYQEPNEIFGVYLSRSLNGRSIFLTVGSFDSSEVYRLDANAVSAPPELFAPRESKHEYSVLDGGHGYFVLTNWQAENFRLMWAPQFPCAKDLWQEVISHDKDVLIESVLCFATHIALGVRYQGLTQIRLLDRQNASRACRVVAFPDPAYVVSFGSHFEYQVDVVRLQYSSMVNPPTAFDCNLATGDLKVVKVREIPNYDASAFAVQRLWATAQDNTRIPLTVFGRKGFSGNSKMPTLMYGYGSYGYSMDPGFWPSMISLAQRGFLIAIAHVRGGSELGRYWYEQGRMMNKMNTFTDFISATEYLVANGYSDQNQLFAMGGSAGGLLMGAILNLRPDLYRGVVAQVPFVDALSTMLDSSLPLTTAEYEQWGNPNEKAAYEYIKSYSPYDNIHAAAYPHILAETGYHDSQVQYWEPAKWVARLRDFKTTDNVVLFRCNMDSGHGGASGRFEYLKETAQEQAFLLWAKDQPRAT